MIALLQRVSRARVTVDRETVGAIGPGVLALIGVQRGDSEAQVRRLLERILGYRLFADADGRMNLSLKDTGGGLLLVPQFTLAADTAKGNRASFSRAAPPAEGERLFAHLARQARATGAAVEIGRFGAEMSVELVNQGPVTFWLEVPPDR